MTEYELEHEYLLTGSILGDLGLCGYVHRKKGSKYNQYHLYLRNNVTVGDETMLTIDLQQSEPEIARFFSTRTKEFRSLKLGMEIYCQESNEEPLSDETFSREINALLTNLMNKVRSSGNQIKILHDVLGAHVEGEDEQEELSIDDVANILDSSPVKNNHFDERLTIETLSTIAWDEESQSAKNYHIFLWYDKGSSKFNYSTTKPPVAVRNKPILDYATFSGSTIRDLLEVDDEPLDFYNNGLPTFRNKSTINTADFRKKIWETIRKTIKQFVYLREDLYDLVTAYIILTYFYDIFDFVPYLDIWGEHSTGKSQLGAVISRLSYRSMDIVGASTAFVYRVLDSVHGLWVGEETQSLFSDDIKKEQRDIIKAGTQKNSRVARVGGSNHERADTFSIFGPKVFQSTELPDMVVMSRCIFIIMKKAPSNMQFQHPDAVIPQTNRLREYLLVLRMMNVYDLLEHSRRNPIGYKNELRDRDRDHAKAILGITQYFYPESMETVKRALVLSLKGRNLLEEDIDVTILDHVATHGYILDEWLSVATLVQNINKFLFGTDQLAKQKNIKKALDNQELGRRLTRLGFQNRRSAKGAEYFFSVEQIVKSYADKGFDASDIFGESVCKTFLDEGMLAGLAPTQLGTKIRSGVQYSLVDLEYSDEERQYIEQQMETDGAEEFSMQWDGLTEEERELVERQNNIRKEYIEKKEEELD